MARNLSLVFCRAPITKPGLWMLSGVIGNPVHVDIGVRGFAFAVSPRRCIQWNLGEWIEARRRTRTLYAVCELDVPDERAAAAAALDYAVGPMTYTGLYRRLRGRPDDLDVDCVAAAMKVLAAGGIAVPRQFKTARSLYLWISQAFPQPKSCSD